VIIVVVDQFSATTGTDKIAGVVKIQNDIFWNRVQIYIQ
jgi:hypothetical protein